MEHVYIYEAYENMELIDKYNLFERSLIGVGA